MSATKKRLGLAAVAALSGAFAPVAAESAFAASAASAGQDAQPMPHGASKPALAGAEPHACRSDVQISLTGIPGAPYGSEVGLYYDSCSRTSWAKEKCNYKLGYHVYLKSGYYPNGTVEEQNAEGGGGFNGSFTWLITPKHNDANRVSYAFATVGGTEYLGHTISY